jgi:hypothetical protein
VEDSQAGVPASSELLGLIDRRLRHIQGEVAHMLTVVQEPGLRASLEAIGRDLEGVLHQMGEPPARPA